MTDPQQIHKAASSLRRAIAPGQDDFAHPDHQDLVAFAESRLGDIDREIVQSHVELCAQCAEDVRDITELREQMTAQAPARPETGNTWKYLVGAAALAAAVLVVAVIQQDREPQSETTQAETVPAPPASPRDTGLSTDERKTVDSAIAAGRVDVPASVRALQGSVGQLLGAEPASTGLLPMSPAGTLVASASPQFSWQPIPGAVSYSVAVFDATFRQVASSNQLKASSWSPAGLPRGVSLAWQVTARMADGSDVLAPAPPRPEARFSVIDETAAAEIANLRSRLADQPIALGILLAKAGLVDDAAREFARAATQPELAELAAKLRASLK